jgi:hypothetical protein
VKLKAVLIILVILFSLLPAWYLNQWLQKIILPRKSFLRFLFYMFLGFVMAFGYTFLVTLVIFKLFPLPRR